MIGNFDACLAEVLEHEGGYVNHPSDPGGETKFGISKRSYPGEDIKGLTKERAGQIYLRDFWNPVRGDELPAGVDLCVFDSSVNSGRSRGVKWLQRALVIEADGAIGPETIGAAAAAPPAQTVLRMCADRMNFLRGLRTWPTFGKGWTKRVDSVRSEALRMAKAAPPTQPAPPTDDAAEILAWLARRPDNWREVVEWLAEMR